MHNLYWGKITTLLVSFSFLASTLSGQVTNSSSNLNFWDFKSKPFYFGLTIGLHSTGYILNKSSEFANSNIRQITTGNNPGLNVNIITNLKIGQYFDFRFIPGFAFSERNIIFEPRADVPDFENRIRVESVFLEVPLLLRFKSAPYKDKRLFVVGGMKYSYDVSSTSNTRQMDAENISTIAPQDFQFEVGAGMQFFFPFFIFSPELKFSRGLNNIHIFNGNLEGSRAIDQILSRAFTISLHFEG